MNGMITTKQYDDLTDPIARMHAYTVTGVVKKTSCKEKYILPHPMNLRSRSKKWRFWILEPSAISPVPWQSVAVKSPSTPVIQLAEEILASHPDGIMLSNGPGDPKENVEIIKEIRKLYGIRCADFCNLPWPPAYGTGHRSRYLQIKNTAIAAATIR